MIKKIAFFLLILSTQLSFGQNTILWQVNDTINNKSSFLLGTFHQFGNSFVDSIPQIKECLLKTELAIFEGLNQTELTQQFINSRTPSDELRKTLSKKDYQLLLEISKNWKVDINKLSPVELSMKLSQELTKVKCKTVNQTDEWDHFDNYLIHLAEKNQIKTHGLESYQEQLKMIGDNVGNPEWKIFKKKIHYQIDQLTKDQFNAAICNFTRKYRNFDLDYQFDKPCGESILIKERNQNWMEVLPNMFNTHNCFLAVGLMHLYGECGLIQQLKLKGFAVNPIEIAKTK